MYSYEDRIRAIELYIKLGKRVRATIRQLGYPTKNALKGWYREHERRGDLARGYHRAPKYSMAQQQGKRVVPAALRPRGDDVPRCA
jgi:transposase-like protein